MHMHVGYNKPRNKNTHNNCGLFGIDKAFDHMRFMTKHITCIYLNCTDYQLKKPVIFQITVCRLR